MARPLRVNVPNGWYHLWARGIDRRAIYRDDRDRVHFLEVLEKSIERYRLVVHAYVLMDNHYHLIVQTTEGNLSKAMQWIATSYSMWHNRRHGRVGPLFQGRYGSSVIEDSLWAYELSVYLHLNPVRTAAYDWGKRRRKADNAGLGRDPGKEEVSRKLQDIREYRWSSYRAYAGYEKGVKWLERTELLKRAKKGPKAEQCKAYREDVQGWIKQGVEEAKSEQLRDRLAVGSEAFVKRLKKSIGKPRREESGKGKIRRKVSFEEVVRAVERLKGESWQEFRRRYGDWGKGHVYWFARERCGMTLREIGEACGGVDYSAVGAVLSRFDKECGTSRKLKQQRSAIDHEISNIET